MTTQAGVQDDLFAFLAVFAVPAVRDVLAPRPVRDTPAALHAVHTDWRPSRVSARESLRLAINECARLHEDRVHISLFRRLLPPTVPPASIGASIAGWTAAGYLRLTNEVLPMGGTAGNGNKRSPVRILVRPIPGDLDTRKS